MNRWGVAWLAPGDWVKISVFGKVHLSAIIRGDRDVPAPKSFHLVAPGSSAVARFAFALEIRAHQAELGGLLDGDQVVSLGGGHEAETSVGFGLHADRLLDQDDLAELLPLVVVATLGGGSSGLRFARWGRIAGGAVVAVAGGH